jgi:hypothetical protein
MVVGFELSGPSLLAGQFAEKKIPTHIYWNHTGNRMRTMGVMLLPAGKPLQLLMRHAEGLCTD